MSASAARSRVLVVRVWFEPGHERDVRVRIIEAAGRDELEKTVLTTTSHDDACRTVCAWLAAVAAGGSS